MPLQEEYARSGQWLFRWRSYLPVAVLVVLLCQLPRFEYLGGSHLLDRWWEVLCLSVSFLGLGVRVLTIGHTPRGTSGRNTKGQLAEELNTTGMYSLVRHPLYVGNFLIWMGIALFVHSVLVTALVAAAFLLYYERIMFAEEAFLRGKFGAAYEEWAERTPAFVPRLRGWVRPSLPFSPRNVLRREYSAFFAIVGCLTLLEVVSDYVVESRLTLDPMWGGLFAVALAAYLTLRFLKRRTRVLHVPGR